MGQVRRVLANPRTALRLTLGIIIVGGLLAAIGSLLRDLIDGRNDQWTFLFDTFGLLLAAVAAVLDFRTQMRLGDLELPGARRRAVLLLVSGLAAAILGCLVLGWMVEDDTPAVLRALLSGLMTAGIGCSLAGLLYIGWFGGGDHLERRIQQRAEEEW
ncbi:MAG: hypothetical protein M3Y37_07020 [Chloroflexota bacterium]|nr:hypothetical protein [Chloroflexota bacterium]